MKGTLLTIRGTYEESSLLALQKRVPKPLVVERSERLLVLLLEACFKSPESRPSTIGANSLGAEYLVLFRRAEVL